MQNQDNSELSDSREWVEKYGDTLYGYAMKCVSDPIIAEDLVQETLLAALKARDSFTGASTEKTWLVGILKKQDCRPLSQKQSRNQRRATRTRYRCR